MSMRLHSQDAVDQLQALIQKGCFSSSLSSFLTISISFSHFFSSYYYIYVTVVDDNPLLQTTFQVSRLSHPFNYTISYVSRFHLISYVCLFSQSDLSSESSSRICPSKLDSLS
jgi:hypothetical protein